MAQSKKKTSTRSLKKKFFAPEFGRSFFSIKAVIDNFIRIVAHIFLTADLLDEEDEVFNPNKLLGFADFGEIVVVAGKNINWRKKSSIPQICIWLTAVSMVIFVIAMLFALLMALASNTSMAFAAENDWDSLFTLRDEYPAVTIGNTVYPDRTLYQTEYGTTWLNWMFNIAGEPRPAVVTATGTEFGNMTAKPGISSGIASMLTYYSSACLVLGSVMVSYLFVSVVVDTAASGVFMGKDHDEVWAFPRILFAMCMLVPVTGDQTGLNLGQRAVIAIAKTGSIFATNAWMMFLNGMSNTDGNSNMLALDSIQLDNLANGTFESYLCYWGTLMGNKLSIDDTQKDTAKNNMIDKVTSQRTTLQNEIDTFNGTFSKPKACQLELVTGDRGVPYHTYVGTDWNGISAEKDCLKNDDDPDYSSIVDKAKGFVSKSAALYDREISIIKMFENDTGNFIKPSISSQSDVLSYDYNLGISSTPIAAACGSFAPPFFLKSDVNQIESSIGVGENTSKASGYSVLDYNSVDCSTMPSMSVKFKCTEGQMKHHYRQAFIKAFNNESIYGESTSAPSTIFKTPSPRSDAVEIQLDPPSETKSAIAQMMGKDIKNPDAVVLPNAGSLSSYAFDYVYGSLYSDKTAQQYIPGALSPINGAEDESVMLLQGSNITPHIEAYRERFRDTMRDDIEFFNQSFSRLASSLFGRDEDSKAWNDARIGTQIEKGWVAAGAFYSLLSKINGLGSTVTASSYYYTAPKKEFIGSNNLKTDNYTLETDLTSMVPYLDFVMSKYNRTKLNSQKETSGLADDDTVDSPEAAVSIIITALKKVPMTKNLIEADGADPMGYLVKLGHFLMDYAIATHMRISGLRSTTAALQEASSTLGSAGGDFTLPVAIAAGIASGALKFLLSMIGQMLVYIYMLLGNFFVFGFTLAYYLPLMPFIRFTMGAISWFAAVFQAVLGVPLLMISSISTAKSGMILGPKRGTYLMIVEIFFRPLLMIFGLIGAILILSLSTYIFTDLYDFAWGVSSFHDGFFPFSGFKSIFRAIAYISIYVSTMYGIANISFKMIDDVPEQVMLWLGQTKGYSLGDGDAQKQAMAGAQGAGKEIEKFMGSQGGGAKEDEASKKDEGSQQTGNTGGDSKPDGDDEGPSGGAPDGGSTGGDTDAEDNNVELGSSDEGDQAGGNTDDADFSNPDEEGNQLDIGGAGNGANTETQSSGETSSNEGNSEKTRGQKFKENASNIGKAFVKDISGVDVDQHQAARANNLQSKLDAHSSGKTPLSDRKVGKIQKELNKLNKDK